MGGSGEAISEWGGGGGARGGWAADGVKREVALRGGLEKARERKEGVMAERRRHREDEAVVGMEELRGWILGGGGGRRGEEAVEGDEKRVRCFGLPRRRGEEAHRTRPRRREEGGDGNGSESTVAHTSVTKARQHQSYGFQSSFLYNGVLVSSFELICEVKSCCNKSTSSLNKF